MTINYQDRKATVQRIGYWPVAPDCSGEELVPRGYMEKRLGRTAYRLWQLLLCLRDSDGTFHWPNEKLVWQSDVWKFEHLTLKQVKCGMRRLWEAGLLKSSGDDGQADLGYQEQENGALWYFRRVLGQHVPQGYSGGVSVTLESVPKTTDLWMAGKVERRGGKRPGAGRPRKHPVKERLPRPAAMPYSDNRNRPHMIPNCPESPEHGSLSRARIGGYWCETCGAYQEGEKPWRGRGFKPKKVPPPILLKGSEHSVGSEIKKGPGVGNQKGAFKDLSSPALVLSGSSLKTEKNAPGKKPPAAALGGQPSFKSKCRKEPERGPLGWADQDQDWTCEQTRTEAPLTLWHLSASQATAQLSFQEADHTPPAPLPAVNVLASTEGTPDPLKRKFSDKPDHAAARWQAPASIPAPEAIGKATALGYQIGGGGPGAGGGGADAVRCTLHIENQVTFERMCPRPGDGVVKPASVPSAPLLDAALSPDARVQHLLHVYREAVHARTGRRVYAHVLGLDPRRPEYKRVAAAAEKLIEHKVAPAAWCAWSTDHWRKLQEQRGRNVRTPPSVQWIYNAERIEKWRGWFRAEAGQYGCTKILKGRAHRELSERWAACHLAVCRVEPERVVEVIEQWFPRGLYRRLVDRARDEAANTQSKINAARLRGDFLW